MRQASSTHATLPRAATVRISPQETPRLLVVVDTEEEFDWNATFDRSHTSVSAMRHIGRTQRVFDRFGIKPTYVMDYAVASQPQGYEPLVQLWAEERCSIGAHLHPWINPPYSEDVNTRNSFTCNLEPRVQRDKLVALSERIEAQFATRPTVFKAGRYGLGTTTVTILGELGFDIDMSVCPRLDFSDGQGPSFTEFDASPFFLTDRLLEIPCTIDYTGWLGPLRPWTHRLASSRRLERLRAPGVLARLGAVNRVMLSPEGSTLEEMRSLVKSLLARGCRTFTLSFHSPSVEPGHTPYVRTWGDLQTFLATLERFCEFFMRDVGGVTVTPGEFRAMVSARMTSES